ncbi:hypothetical protein JCM11491_006767 [Sporobolomyces phaffii]
MASHLVPRHGAMAGMAGMDMGQTNGTSAMMMSTYFTTSLGASNLWFSSWTPTTAGATFGACLGLFFLAILSRFLAAVKSCAEVAWAESIRRQHASPRPSSSSSPATSRAASDEKATPPVSADLASILPDLSPSPSNPAPSSSPSPSPPSSLSVTRRPSHVTPQFHLAIDFPRSILFGLQSFVAYLLMLAIMSFSAYFFIAVLVGLMVGELCFGRFIVLLGGGALGGHHGAEHL